MEILVLGAGNIGKAIAHDLSKDFEITIADISEEDLKDVEKYGETKKVDASSYEEVLDSMEGFDLVVESLPGRFGYQALEAAIEAETDIVSVSFMPENPLELQEEAKEAGVTIIPDAGFGPGLPNMCIGIMDQTFDEFDDSTIYIGGLPKDPKPPLYYRITWSPEGLIDEYTREARFVEDNGITRADPLKDIRDVEVKDFEFKAFLSDGLRTLTDTIDVTNLKEWTLRWEGHLRKMKVLRELGFLSEDNLQDTLDMIVPHMTYDSKDFSIMKIEGQGTVEGKEKEIEFYLYDEEKEFTSMSRTTGFTTAVVARLVVEEGFENGVIPPECFDIETSNKVFSELRERDITIEKTE